MTPLALRLVKDIIRDVPSAADAAALRDIHCFDVTEIEELSEGLSERLWNDQYEKGSFDPALAFLPAPRTWIEWDTHKYGRQAFLLLSPASVLSTMASAMIFGAHTGELQNSKMPDLPLHNPNPPPAGSAVECKLQYSIYALLAIINSPHVIGRTVHPPHKGLRRALDHKFGKGNFPLNAWTEIKLAVTPKIAHEYGESVLTGRKALHFCRAHLRIKRGKLEHVSAHWRGDPTRGVKRSRYLVNN